MAAGAAHEASFGRRFAEGLTLQFTNPKAIFLFLSVLPQFIDARQPYAVQFAVLAGTTFMCFGAALAVAKR